VCVCVSRGALPCAELSLGAGPRTAAPSPRGDGGSAAHREGSVWDGEGGAKRGLKHGGELRACSTARWMQPSDPVSRGDLNPSDVPAFGYCAFLLVLFLIALFSSAKSATKRQLEYANSAPLCVCA